MPTRDWSNPRGLPSSLGSISGPHYYSPELQSPFFKRAAPSNFSSFYTTRQLITPSWLKTCSTTSPTADTTLFGVPTSWCLPIEPRDLGSKPTMNPRATREEKEANTAQRTAGEPLQEHTAPLRSQLLPVSRQQARPGRFQPQVREYLHLRE